VLHRIRVKDAGHGKNIVAAQPPSISLDVRLPTRHLPMQGFEDPPGTSAAPIGWLKLRQTYDEICGTLDMSCLFIGPRVCVAGI
jgi:hypothetical protein